MRWQTETRLPEYPFSIDHNDTIILMGSCFAENIGDRLRYFKFNISQNPFGIIYNPLSLLHTVRMLTSAKVYTNEDLEFNGTHYFSYDHHSRFSHPDPSVALNAINDSLNHGRKALNGAKVIFISLGTSFYWERIADKQVVSNCHKQPGSLFEQKLAGYHQVRSALTEVITTLTRSNPSIHIVFTVSPVRHLKHGSLGNQRSKATLLLAAQELAETVNQVHYFPSYELIMDDLRDYRFFEEDLIHPNKVAIDHIWEQFEEACINRSSKPLMAEIDKMRKLLSHRPMLDGGLNQHYQLLKRRSADLLAHHIDFEPDVQAWYQTYR